MIKTPNSGNILSIQFLRGIAAFLVLLHHTISSRYLPATNYLTIFSSRGWMGVNIFFIISGFIIPYSMFIKNYKISDFGGFFIKRITRIEPPYIVSIVFVLLLNYLVTLSSAYKGLPVTVDWGNVLGHLGYLNAFTQQPWLNLAYWTLAIEFEFYLLMALVYPIIVNDNKAVMFVTYFALLIISFIKVPGVHIIVYLPFFLLGVGMFLYQCDKISVIALVITSVFSLIVIYYNHGDILFWVSIAVLLSIRFIKRVPKPFLWLGTISYSLYLTHNVIVSRFIALEMKYIHHMNIGLAIFLCLAFCILFAWLYYIVVEKPFINLARKIKFQHSGKKDLL